VNRTGGLWFSSKERTDRGVFATTPGIVFVKSHLYSSLAADGSRNPALELDYSKVKSLADPIIDKIVPAARVAPIASVSPDELEVWHRFFFNQPKWAPDFIGQIDEIRNFPDRIEQVLASLEAEIGHTTPAHLRQQVTEEGVIERIRRNAIVGSPFDATPMVMEVLRARGLVIRSQAVRPNPSCCGATPWQGWALGMAHRLRIPRSSFGF